MNHDELLLCWLSTKINLNPERYNAIFDFYESFESAILDGFAKLPPEKWLQKFVQPLDLAMELQKFHVSLEAHQIQFITFLSPLYPEKLKILGLDLPMVLYYQGNIKLLQKDHFITVVGSRNISNYSKILMENTLKRACRLGVGVVSGLAVGVDGFSHEIALAQNAPTIGVIGSGLDDDNFYPIQNLALKNHILQSDGLVLSEYPPGVKATVYTFPRRNRILAALTDVTWVVQAGLKSGTLITATLATEMGKTVATTPNSIFDKDYSGNLKLIKDGANIITDPEDIIQLLGLATFQNQTQNVVQEITFDDPQQKLVYEILDLKPCNIEDLALKSGLGFSLLVSTLTMLEVNGLALNVGSNEWVKSI
jgi:DNA processing protein